MKRRTSSSFFFFNFIFNSGDGGCNLEPFISRLNLIDRTDHVDDVRLQSDGEMKS